MDTPETTPIERLRAIMARLRDPDHGCPWDQKQDFASVAPYTLEEACEVVDAIDRGDMHDLRDELGDLLFQVVFHARLAEEAGSFTFNDVANAISDKLVRRHPHVFGTAHYANLAEQRQAWEAIKADERAARGAPADVSAIAGVSRGLPAWRRAQKLQQKAAAVGFEWPAVAPVLDKLEEEVAEVRAECTATPDVARIEAEIGDVLFVLVNVARHTGADYLRALRGANAKFERRFRAMEQMASAEGHLFADLTLDQQEQLWRRVKAAENAVDRV